VIGKRGHFLYSGLHLMKDALQADINCRAKSREKGNGLFRLQLQALWLFIEARFVLSAI
jgi:hypothetical protein